MDSVVFSEWIKRRRKALDLTQDELAGRAGCSVGALRKIESGDRRPSKQLAGLLAKALEIPNGDQQTFIRVARGEVNLERLPQPFRVPRALLPELSSLRPVQPGATSPSPPVRLPFQATPLIGRETDLAAMERIIHEPQCRLFTLTGIGGIGKTRLALEFASRNLSFFPGGVFYIELTPVNSPEKIPPVIADVLGFSFSGPNDPKEQLISYISNNIRQAALFIFNNLEQLLVPASSNKSEKPGLVELITEILLRLPDVKILGTSRERLNLLGEWTYEVHGLSVPPANFFGQLEEYDSITLFVKCAQRIKADFQAAEDEQMALVRICQLVEGVPLAIELAAAWVGVLSCQEIAQEIQSNLDFLTTSMRNLPERHRSIRATYDHSWKLLSEEERWALCQLAIFQGGFDRHAASQIAGASLSILASLCAKSLVRRTEHGRYDLHELTRQYALSHFKDDTRKPDTCARHCEYYLALVRDHEKSLKSASQQEAVRRLTDEIDNLRAAWAWAIHHKKIAQLERAGRAFGWFFEIAGLYREGIEQLELLVQTIQAMPKDEQNCRVLGLMFVHQALLFFRKGELDQARKLYEDSLTILRPIGDQTLLADALIFLGVILHSNGEYQQARSLVEEGLVFARTENERWFEAFAIYNLGYITTLMGHCSKGVEQMMAGLAMWRTLGDPQSIAMGLNFLVPPLSKLGRCEEAKAFMQESILLCEQAKNRWGKGTAYRFLGLACIAAGQYTEAQAHLRTSLEIFADFSQGWDIARSLAYLGDATRLAGELSAARKYYRDALRLSMETKAFPIALDTLLGLSILQAQAGDAEHALLLCHYIVNHPSSEEHTKHRAEQLCADIEIILGPDQVRIRQTEAHEKTFEMIVKTALEITYTPG
jgi:predicted ATPase/transcriptional regulator with XRE-family HTH domain